MIIENNDRNSLIKYRLEQAEETILDVQLLIEMFNEMQEFISKIKKYN